MSGRLLVNSSNLLIFNEIFRHSCIRSLMSLLKN